MTQYYISDMAMIVNTDIIHQHAGGTGAQVARPALSWPITDLHDKIQILMPDEGLFSSVTEFLFLNVPEKWDQCPELLEIKHLFLKVKQRICPKKFWL